MSLLLDHGPDNLVPPDRLMEALSLQQLITQLTELMSSYRELEYANDWLREENEELHKMTVRMERRIEKLKKALKDAVPPKRRLKKKADK